MSNDTSSYLYHSPETKQKETNLTGEKRQSHFYLHTDKNSSINGCSFLYIAETDVKGNLVIEHSHDIRFGDDFKCEGNIEIVDCANISLAQNATINGKLIIKKSRNVYVPKDLGEKLQIDKESTFHFLYPVREFQQTGSDITPSAAASSAPTPIKQNSSHLTLESK